jgi:hypothetical protein
MAPGSPSAGFPAAGGGFPGERSSANPPPEFYGPGYGQQDPQGSGGYPQRTPGRSLHDLSQRDAGYGQDGGYGDNGYGQDGGYGQEAQYGQNGQNGQNGQTAGGYQSGGYSQDSGYGQDGGYGQDWGAADQADGWRGGGGGGTAGQPSPWDDRGQRDAGYQDLDGGFGRQDPGRLGYSAQDYAGQDYPAQDYAGQDYPGQQGRGLQEPSPYGRRDEAAARQDPALQDFFAPQDGYAPQPGGGPGAPREPRFRPEDNGWGGWDGPADRPAPPRSGTGPRPVPRAARGGGGGGDERRGLGTRGYVVIGLVIAVIIVLAYVVLTKGSGNKTPTAGNSPSGSTTSAPAKPSGSTSAAATTAYKLSTPTTAGGYPQGQDPHFLTTATATAGQIVTSVKSGGGGTVKGNPVSAAYQLPLSQVITFVGYQGTFTPAKVATILATLGTDPHTYPAGPNGGMLGCANTAATATVTSGAVCVWATTSTLGVTEFFSATGPEALTTSQSKGADDTVKLRADVEAKS